MSTEHKTNTRTIIFIFILALGLRLGYTAFLHNDYFFYDHPSSDVTYYQDWAHEIATGNWLGDKTFYGLPLYPYFLAMVERIALGYPFIIRLLHILLGAVNCCLVFLVAKEIFNSQMTAVLAGVLSASNFILIYYDWLMMPVTLLIFLSLIIVLSFMNASSIQKTHEWLILGFLLGLTILGDGKFLFFFVLAVGYLFQQFRSDTKRLTKTIIPIIIGVCLVLFSVTLRNKIVGGSWVFISAQSGLSLYAGNSPYATGIFENPEFIRPTHRGQDEDQQIIAEQALKKTLSPAEVSDFWRSKAISFIKNNPLDYLNLLKTKFLLFFTQTERANDLDLILQRQWRQQWDFNSFYVLCPLAILGMGIAWSLRRENIYINFLILSQFIMTLIFFLTTRHRSTIIPFLIIYEAFFVCWCFEKFRSRQFNHLIYAIAFILFFLLSFRPESIEAKSVDFLRYSKSGPIYERQGDYQKAQIQYFKALTLRPQDTNTLYNLGNTFLLQKKFAQAEQSYLKAIHFCHYNVDALYNLGYAYEETQNFNLAIKYYTKVLNYENDSIDAHLRLAGVYKKMNNCPKAVDHYQTITKINPRFEKEVQALIAQCPVNP